ncbi:uncharacterized protein n4bp2l2 isoform X2 [Paramormyrops kingsleyae]
MLNLCSSASVTDAEDRGVREPLASKVQTCIQDTDAVRVKNEEETVVRLDGPPEAAVTERLPIAEDRNPQEAREQSVGSQGQSSDTINDSSLIKCVSGRSACSSPKVEDVLSKKDQDQGEGARTLGSGSPGRKDGRLVDGQWVIRSTAFIGPMCRPEPAESKGDLDDKLSEFYKELEEMEPAETPDISTDKVDSHVEAKKSINSTPSEEGFHVSRGPRPYRRPYMYRDAPNEEWHSWKRRRDFRYGPDHSSWDPYYQNQWQHPPPFGGPPCPPYPRFGEPKFYGPPKFPPPPNPLYHPAFRPHMSTFYDSPPIAEWEQPFPPGSDFAGYDGYGDHYSSQGYGESFYPPYDLENNQANGCSSHGSRPWFQSYEQDGSDYRICPDIEFGPQQHHLNEEFCEPSDSKKGFHGSSLVLILMRGLPGSGKSTLAQELLSSGPNGLVLSTDDYFSQETGYAYDPGLLGDAHSWNQNRAREAMDENRSPVIIDNTNMQAWEMKPYAEMAVERGYRVDFCEPSTNWKLDPTELEKRNKHGVSRQKILEMLERFELPMSLDIVLNSQQPLHKSRGHSSTQPKQRLHDTGDNVPD